MTRESSAVTSAVSSAAVPTSAERLPATRWRAGFIASPAYDGVFFLGAPLLSLLLGFLFSVLPAERNQIMFLDQPAFMTTVALKTIIHSHLVIVFFRSHGNPSVNKRHPVRFFVVPVVLLASMMVSLEVLAIVLVVTTYWDMIHSSLQTFGIGRIYDAKAGADVHAGRRWDLWLNHLIYLGPFVAGPLWVVASQVLRLLQGSADGATGALAIPGIDALAAAMVEGQPAFRVAILVVAPLYLVGYAVHVVQRARRGERLSWQKHALFATTAIASVWAWGFNSFGQALLVVNTFHAVQYFAIVWWSERDHMRRLFGTHGLPWGRVLTLFGFIVVGVAYGFWLGSVSDFWATDGWLKRGVLALTNTVAVLHFWYDGFIWSVRKRDV